MESTINFEKLSENCEIIATRDIRFNGYLWKPWRYLYVAMRAFDGQDAVESIALECQIIIDGQAIDGIVRMHRDGRVYPMSREAYDTIMEIQGGLA